jgi:hypothetical protein
MHRFLRFVSVSLSLLIAAQSPMAYGQELPVPAPRMSIAVVEGAAVIHNLQQRKPVSIVVIVRDGNRRPIPDAAVTFTLPNDGPGGLFAGGTNTLTVQTDAQGYAAAQGLTPNNTPGSFAIQVQSTHEGQTATATVTQFNMAVERAKGGKGKWIAILAVAGGAAAGGAVFGLRSSSPAAAVPGAAPTPIGITAGSGTVGPPR